MTAMPQSSVVRISKAMSHLLRHKPPPGEFPSSIIYQDRLNTNQADAAPLLRPRCAAPLLQPAMQTRAPLCYIAIAFHLKATLAVAHTFTFLLCTLHPTAEMDDSGWVPLPALMHRLRQPAATEAVIRQIVAADVKVCGLLLPPRRRLGAL